MNKHTYGVEALYDYDEKRRIPNTGTTGHLMVGKVYKAGDKVEAIKMFLSDAAVLEKLNLETLDRIDVHKKYEFKKED